MEIIKNPKYWELAAKDDQVVKDFLKPLKLLTLFRASKYHHEIGDSKRRVVLRNREGTAIIIFMSEKDPFGERGINLKLFINNSSVPSDELLIEAMRITRLFTPVTMFFFDFDEALLPANGKGILRSAGWRVDMLSPKDRDIFYSNAYAINDFTPRRHP